MKTDIEIAQGAVMEPIENIAAKLGTDAGKVYDALAQSSDILSNYIVSG